MGWGNKAIEIRSVESGHLDGVFMHKKAQRLKFLCERNDKVFFSSAKGGSSCQIYFMTLNKPGMANWQWQTVAVASALVICDEATNNILIIWSLLYKPLVQSYSKLLAICNAKTCDSDGLLCAQKTIHKYYYIRGQSIRGPSSFNMWHFVLKIVISIHATKETYIIISNNLQDKMF